MICEMVGTRTDLLKLLPKDSIGIEIGVFKGEFSKQILEIAKPKMLYLLDRFEGLVASGDKDGNNRHMIDLGSYYTGILLPKYRKHPNVTIVKADTSEIRSFAYDLFDWCYIDAGHTYEEVMHDLQAISPKVKAGGWIMGHDYAQRTAGVKQAVNDFCKATGYEIAYLTNDKLPSYAIRKQLP